MKTYICEECQHEHDGSYGSGRFCSLHCRKVWCGKISYQKRIINGTFKGNLNIGNTVKRAKYGTWKCKRCNIIFETRAKLLKHNQDNHTRFDEFGNKIHWNKGLTKEIDERVAKYGKTYSSRIASGQVIPSFKGKHHTEETKKKLALKGGKRSHSGRGKQGRYHGIWCDSSLELAWIIYQEDHQVKFKKYHGYFEYEFEGAKHKYYPDFVLEDGTIVEIKGYWSKQWQAKLDQLPKDKKLLILGKNEMTPILEYVKTKYGDNFVQLYE